MTEDVRVRRHISNIVIKISAVVWVLILIGPYLGLEQHGVNFHGGICYGNAPVILVLSNSFLEIATSTLSINTLFAWFMMLIAMMLPTLVDAFQHVWARSFTHRRFQALSLFIVGYTALWMLAGALILSSTTALNIVFEYSSWLIVAMVTITVIWQCSPIKQLCLNRNHNHSELRAFGLGADVDALMFGIKHGAWCVLSCWALMTLPMMLVEGHTIVMILVAFIMISESLERPTQARWHIRLPIKLISIIKYQTQIRLEMPLAFKKRRYST